MNRLRDASCSFSFMLCPFGSHRLRGTCFFVSIYVELALFSTHLFTNTLFSPSPSWVDLKREGSLEEVGSLQHQTYSHLSTTSTLLLQILIHPHPNFPAFLNSQVAHLPPVSLPLRRSLFVFPVKPHQSSFDPDSLLKLHLESSERHGWEESEGEGGGRRGRMDRHVWESWREKWEKGGTLGRGE